ncbi:GM10892 [Drosophila sechellia]|uniref:GM10892 n=1 Tax=Drosophila sechellia TaxID=7238 RepID=B4I4F6_DROSE|nr:GM10892 [Drosophila sechellia]
MLALVVLLIASCLVIQTAGTTTPSTACTEAGTPTRGGSTDQAELGNSSATELPDYCYPSVCHKNLKHVACNASIELHDKCSLDAEVIVISPRVERFLLGRFNELRDRVAKGGFNGLSPASRMGTLKWNSELAYLAEFNVRDCVLRHDECRNTKFTQNAGQTVGYRGIKGKLPELEDILRDIIGVWMREKAGTSMVTIMKYADQESHSPKYNFLQIVQENAEFVGCAIVQQSRHGWIQTFFACNYGHAPVVGSPVYESGQKAAESCKAGTNPKYAHLCADSEVYEKVAPKGVNASSPEINTRTLGKRDFVMLNADGTAPAEDGAPAPAADGAAAAPAAEGGAAPPAEAAATTAVDGAAPGATPGVTPVEGAGSTSAPAAGVTPASGSPGGEEAHAEGLLEPMPKPLDRAALEKKFARFLALIKRAEMFHGRRKIVVISSNHEVDDDRVQQEGAEADSTIRTMERAFSRRRAIMRRSIGSHMRGRRQNCDGGKHEGFGGRDCRRTAMDEMWYYI